MKSNDTVVVLDMDGVLLDLGLNTEKVREQIHDDFLSAGLEQRFIPLIKSITRACEKLAEKDPELARQMNERAWAHIDAEELRAARRATPRGDVVAFLDRLSGLPLALYTNNSVESARVALRSAGIDADRFSLIIGREGPASLKPSAKPIERAFEDLACAATRRLFMIGDHPFDMEAAVSAKDLLRKKGASQAEVIAIGMRKNDDRNGELERSGADFLAADLEEAALLVLTEPLEVSVSFVLLAYNEEDLIEKAIEDVRAFARRYVPGYEVVVVDDGSTDQTNKIVSRLRDDDLKVVVHPVNRGMGTSMRDGYRAATKDYIVHLPGDRQVRANSLISFLPHLREDRVVLSRYANPPSGQYRALMSLVFRRLLRAVGGLEVDFAGTYIFKRSLLARVDPPDGVASHTFLYSFQLLSNLRRLGLGFHQEVISPFAREVGPSREATLARTLNMTKELVRHRIASRFPGLFRG